MRRLFERFLLLAALLFVAGCPGTATLVSDRTLHASIDPAAVPPGIAFHRGANAVFDPATLPLSGWWRGSFSASPWNGTASAGASNGRNLSEATNPPASGTAQNGFNPADCDGTNDELSIGTALSSFYSASAWTIIVLFRADAAPGPTANLYDGGTFVSDTSSSALVNMVITTSGVQVSHFDGAWPGVTVAASTAAYHAAFAEYDGTDIKLAIDSGGFSTQAASNVSSLGTGNLRVCKDWNGGTFYDGRLLEIMLSQSAIAVSNRTDVKGYFNTRYALSL